MRKRWKGIDTFVAILLVGSLLGMALMLFLFSGFFIGNKQPVELPVSSKISEKGHFFSPVYKVKVEKQGISYVTKNQFYEVDIGDKLSGYQTNNMPFFTTLDILYDGAMLITLILIFTVLILIFGYYFYRKFSNKLEKRDTPYPRKFKLPKKFIYISALIYIIISCSFLFFFFNNLRHQLIPIDHTYTEANIVDDEIEKGYGRFVTDTHYFYIGVTDEEGQEYLVKKQVNYELYKTYQHRYGIPIHYPSGDPANAFIQLQSVEEYVTPLLSFQTLLILSIIYSYNRLYRWYKSSQNHANRNEDEKDAIT